MLVEVDKFLSMLTAINTPFADKSCLMKLLTTGEDADHGYSLLVKVSYDIVYMILVILRWKCLTTGKFRLTVKPV